MNGINNFAYFDKDIEINKIGQSQINKVESIKLS